MSPADRSALARFGPFFAVDAPTGDGWRPLAELSDPMVLRSRIAGVGAALGALAPEPIRVPDRVATSIAHLGLVARLAAVALAAETDGLPVPGPDGWWWQDALGGPYPVAVGPGASAGDWPDRLRALVGPLTTTTIDVLGLSVRIARGNVASGLAGAAAMISTVDPTAGERAGRAVRDALAAPALTGTGAYELGRFRRRSCCLIYRLADPPAYCGDCVLSGPRRPASAPAP